MSYTKHDFKTGDILYAKDMAEMDEQIAEHDSKVGEVVFEEKIRRRNLLNLTFLYGCRKWLKNKK